MPNVDVQRDQVVAPPLRWRELWLKEDWWAIWLGLGIVLVAYVFFANGANIRWIAVTPSKWSTLAQLGGIRCKAAYAVNATGKAFQQTLRCASNSYRVEISRTSFPKAVRCPVPGPRRPAVWREIFPAAPAVRRSAGS